MPITINGSTKQVPDVYGTTKVMNVGATATPPFNGLLIVGNARQGAPYNGGKGYEVIKSFSSVSDARAFYGESDLVNAMQEAKKGGAGVIYALNTSPITRGLFTVKDTNTTPKNLFDVKPKSFGAAGNDIRLDVTNTAGAISITVTPSKDTHFILEDLDATGKKSTKIDGLSGLAVGDVVKAVDNASATYSTHTIVDIDTLNNRVVLDTNIISKTQAQYARIFKVDTDNKKTKVWSTTETGLLNGIMNWLQATGLFDVSRPSNYDGDITLINGTYANHFGLLVGATKGTSPIGTETAGGDFVLCAQALEKLLEEFSSFTGSRVRIVNVLSADTNVHGAFLALAASARTNQKSILIVSGCALGDINLAKNASNHPIVRAKGLNSDDFVLVGHGYDDKPAYLSLAPQFAGMISANAIQKNFTKDSISASKVEYFFGEFNKETETTPFVNAGVLVVQTEKRGFTIALACNTYQKRDTIWNQSDNKTYLIQQRQIVDYVFEDYREAMQQGVGSENFDLITASSVGLDCLNRHYDNGIITDKKIAKAYRVGNAIFTVPQIIPLEATDFIGFELQITAS